MYETLYGGPVLNSLESSYIIPLISFQTLEPYGFHHEVFTFFLALPLLLHQIHSEAVLNIGSKHLLLGEAICDTPN